MQTRSLHGQWSVRHEGMPVIGTSGLTLVESRQANWLSATVPGEVHLDLMNAGLMEEPLFSTNAPACRWPEDRSWWYRTTFETDAAFMEEACQELVFEGLDYYAQVFLNGVLLGEAENALVPAVFDVKHVLKSGKNTLVVRLTAGTERAANQQTGESTEAKPYGGRQAFKGITELRKPQFSYGWDWVDSLPNIGIWRGVRLEGYTGLRVRDVRTATKLQADVCSLSVDVDVANLHPWSEQTAELEVTLVHPNGTSQTVAHTAMVPVGILRCSVELPVENPELWWPNGMGDQPLYTVRAEVKQDAVSRDVWERHVGLRTISIDRSPLPEGHRFVIQVNGQEVFCRGANWIPADAILARATKERVDALVAEAKNANMTMLRIWGGGVYESDDFYAACDRAGVLVWQDFMFACGTYPDDREAFRNKIRAEAEAAIRRLRHHPSIALWCGNNENIWGFHAWWNRDKSFPQADLVLGGHHIYSEILPVACQTLDPSRPYWPGSPAGGLSPNSETEGDCHWWGPGTMNADIHRRYRDEVYDECRSRFVSEYGVVGPCHLESFQHALRPEEVDVNHHAWKVHTNSFEKATTPTALRYHYADPETLSIEQYIRYGQLFQAILYGRSVDSMRFRKHDPQDDCAGALIWMYNDCWCETGWTPIDYYLRRKASYYWLRNAFMPVRGIVRRRGDEAVVRVVNDTLSAVGVAVTAGWFRVDGAETRTQVHSLTLPANGMVEVIREPIPEGLDTSAWVYGVHCAGPGIAASQSILPLLPHRQLATVRQPTITVTQTGAAITLVSDAYCHGVCSPDAGEAVFSDNYFDLLPGIPKTIQCLRPGVNPSFQPV